jgi:hypothetical protein
MRCSHVKPILIALLCTLLPPALAAQSGRSHSPRDAVDRDWLRGCRDNGDDDRGRFCEERTLGWRARAGEQLSVDAGPNGGVTVIGWDRDSVDVRVRLGATARTDADAEALAREVRVTREGGTLRADGPGTGHRDSWWVSYVIRAPRRADLALETVNGPLGVADVSGRMQLDVVNGPLALDNVGGDVHARAQNGPLSVVLTGTRWDGAGLDASTVNGPLTLDVPEGYNAQLVTGTRNGPMHLGFPVTVQGRIGAGSRSHLETTLGGGGPTIRAVTTNGPATIRRR